MGRTEVEKKSRMAEKQNLDCIHAQCECVQVCETVGVNDETISPCTKEKTGSAILYTGKLSKTYPEQNEEGGEGGRRRITFLLCSPPPV